ncbi:MAG TPA: ATP-binding protein [Kofleriaceae bacterium]|nr:ATP-binding protein [Kofleriaceae bacterium]
MDLLATIALIDALGRAGDRLETAQRLAKHFGGKALFVLVPDPDRPNTWIPAHGFRGIPSMRGWRELLSRCVNPGTEAGAVAYPDARELDDAIAYVFDGILFVLVGAPATHRDEVRRHLGFNTRVLGAMLRDEAAVRAMRGQLEIERLNAERTTSLAKALDRARSDAQHAIRVKDEFLAMLGHELRNPLAPIVTALQLLRMENANSRAQAVIERHVSHMVRLVDDLLDMSRINSDKIELRKQPLEVGPVITRAVEMVRPLIEQRRNRLVVEVPDRGLVVDGDPARLAQVISNLVTNAAKYSDAGTRIEVRAERVHDRVRISVVDEGIGIEASYLENVFEQFVQTPQGLDRAAGGLGLGLAIVRSIVERHGGTVRAASEGVGTGSTFVVELPICHAVPVDSQTDDAPPASLSKGTGAHILVVDDNKDAAAMLAEVLSAYGHRVDVAHDAHDALSRLEQVTPDAALLDIGLPDMDGYALAQAVRSRLPAIKLIALTGYGQANDRERSRAAGFDAHLVKPVTIANVTRTLEDLLR